MDRRKFLVTAGGMASLGFSCLAAPTSAWSQANPRRERALVAYFSWGGNTRGIARQIHQKTGGDMFEIEPVPPYSRDYSTCLDEALRDQRARERPALRNRVGNIGQYDVIFLGYPNWWATIPMPIASFLEGHDFAGKTIAPFCSHGGGRLGQSVTDIAKLSPQSRILEALSVHYSGGSSLPGDIDAWLRKIGMSA